MSEIKKNRSRFQEAKTSYFGLPVGMFYITYCTSFCAYLAVRPISTDENLHIKEQLQYLTEILP